MMINNTYDDGKETIRKLPSSIIFDARPSGESIKINCSAKMNSKLPVVDSMAYRYRGNCMSQHTSPRHNPAILLCLRGVATPMCYEQTTRNSFQKFFLTDHLKISPYTSWIKCVVARKHEVLFTYFTFNNFTGLRISVHIWGDSPKNIHRFY